MSSTYTKKKKQKLVTPIYNVSSYMLQKKLYISVNKQQQ